jgi:hypothetical protein
MFVLLWTAPVSWAVDQKVEDFSAIGTLEDDDLFYCRETDSLTNNKCTPADMRTAIINEDSVDPTALEDSDTEADEECYTYEATGTTGEWQDCSTHSFVMPASDETTTLTTGTDKFTFRIPYAFTVTEVRCSLNVAHTTGTFTADIHESGTTIMSTDKCDIDANETTSESATTAPAVTDSSLADDAEISVDIDSIGSAGSPAGLKVTIIGRKS